MDILRKIEEKLENWSKEPYALLVYGSRQVGKTYTLKKYLNSKYSSFFYLNLHNNINAIKIIIESKNVDDFLLRLSSLSNNIKFDSNTCIFIDEIQEYYTYLEKHKNIEEYFDIIFQSKNIVTNTKHRFVMSGSLLRLELNNLITNPTGYVLPLEMYPLDFEEFLIANNINKELISVARNSFEEEKEVPEYIHKLFIDLFKKYLLVGGMPQAVSEFIDKNSFTAVDDAHKTIDYFIKEDITKYVEDNEKLKIKDIYNLIPTELSNPTRKFIISHLKNHNKNENEQLSFSWLNAAGITISVYNTKEPTIPLVANSSRNQFKLFHEDVGLLTYMMLSKENKQLILNEKLSINLGMIYENAVAQNLYAHGYENLYYYNSKKYGEVDFIVEKKGKVLPIEIKSGKNYYYHRALNNIMDIEKYNISKAIVFTNENTIVDKKIIYFPIYLIMFV